MIYPSIHPSIYLSIYLSEAQVAKATMRLPLGFGLPLARLEPCSHGPFENDQADDVWCCF